MKLTGENRRTRGKTCPSATLSTTNPTWTDPGLRGERPATNRLSHGTAMRLNRWFCGKDGLKGLCRFFAKEITHTHMPKGP
jgi:hypothetical protein